MTVQHTQPDFTGQHIYVGIDVGKKKWIVCILTEVSEHKVFTQGPQVSILAKYLHRTFPGATYHCVYEAGFCGFWIQKQFQEHHIDCIVVHPADVPTTHREKAFKTDRIDARKLARTLRNGDLEALYVPSRHAQEDRSLVRLRWMIVKDQTRCKNQIKALLSYYGIDLPEEIATSHWSKNFLKYLDSISMEQASGDAVLKLQLAKLLSLRQFLVSITKQIRALAHENRYCQSVSCLISAPGISTLTAMILLTELVDIHRFKTLDDLAAYCGLVPGEHSTGEDEIITGITSRRNPFLRRILIESAWVAVRKDPALILAFNILAKRMPKNCAIVRIARKLLNRIRFVLLHQQPYQPAVMAA